MIKKAYEEQRIKDMELWEIQEEERVTPYNQSISADEKILLCLFSLEVLKEVLTNLCVLETIFREIFAGNKGS